MIYDEYKKALFSDDIKDTRKLERFQGIYAQEMDKNIEHFYNPPKEDYMLGINYSHNAFEYLQCYMVVKLELMRRKYC